MKKVLKLASKLGTLQRFCFEIALRCLIFKMLADLLETLLTVNEILNNGAQSLFYFRVCSFCRIGVCRHLFLPFRI